MCRSDVQRVSGMCTLDQPGSVNGQSHRQKGMTHEAGEFGAQSQKHLLGVVRLEGLKLVLMKMDREVELDRTGSAFKAGNAFSDHHRSVNAGRE